MNWSRRLGQPRSRDSRRRWSPPSSPPTRPPGLRTASSPLRSSAGHPPPTGPWRRRVSVPASTPPCFRASALANAIRYACLHRTNVPRLLTITANGVTYPTAAVRTAVMLIHPRRVYGDPGDAARYTTDVQLDWTMTNDRLE